MIADLTNELSSACNLAWAKVLKGIANELGHSVFFPSGLVNPKHYRVIFHSE